MQRNAERILQNQIAGKVLLIEETQIGTRKVLMVQDGADTYGPEGNCERQGWDRCISRNASLCKHIARCQMGASDWLWSKFLTLKCNSEDRGFVASADKRSTSLWIDEANFPKSPLLLLLLLLLLRLVVIPPAPPPPPPAEIVSVAEAKVATSLRPLWEEQEVRLKLQHTDLRISS